MNFIRQQIFTSFAVAFCLFAGGCSELSKTRVSELKPDSAVNAAELDWKDFYKTPVGPLGLEPTPKLLSLENKPVRLRGYMVKEEEPVAGLFMLTTRPVNLSEKEDGPADDLPAATVFVHMPEVDKRKVVNFRSGLWELVGTLKLGNQEEDGGRTSYTRLILE